MLDFGVPQFLGGSWRLHVLEGDFILSPSMRQDSVSRNILAHKFLQSEGSGVYQSHCLCLERVAFTVRKSCSVPCIEERILCARWSNREGKGAEELSRDMTAQLSAQLPSRYMVGHQCFCLQWVWRAFLCYDLTASRPGYQNGQLAPHRTDRRSNEIKAEPCGLRSVHRGNLLGSWTCPE